MNRNTTSSIRTKRLKKRVPPAVSAFVEEGQVVEPNTAPMADRIQWALRLKEVRKTVRCFTTFGPDETRAYARRNVRRISGLARDLTQTTPPDDIEIHKRTITILEGLWMIDAAVQTFLHPPFPVSDQLRDAKAEICDLHSTIGAEAYRRRFPKEAANV